MTSNDGERVDTFAWAAGGASVVLLEPFEHVIQMSAMATVVAPSVQPLHGQVA